MKDTRKLSKLQKVILRRLSAYVRQCRAEGLQDNGPGLPRGVLFVPMKWLRAGASKTKSESAAYSRALRELEKRGLLIRSNLHSGMHRGPRAGAIRVSLDEPAPARSDHVILTPAGEAAIAARREEGS
jgi:hypothetical protein